MEIKMLEVISKSTAKLLKDLTGEPRLDTAVRIAVKNSLIHRLEDIEPKIEKFKKNMEWILKLFEKRGKMTK